MTQSKAILDYLLTGKGLTQEEARRRFGCSRLAARIGEFKAAYKIMDAWEEFIDRYGNAGRVKRYWITGRKEA